MASLTVDQKLANLESRLAQLEKLLSVASDGSVTINAPKITLQSPVVELKAQTSLILGSTGWVDLKSGGMLRLMCGSDIYFQGSGLQTKTNYFNFGTGGGASVVGASNLVLNGGKRPLARVGDAITSSGAPAGMTGVIASNASTILG